MTRVLLEGAPWTKEHDVEGGFALFHEAAFAHSPTRGQQARRWPPNTPQGSYTPVASCGASVARTAAQVVGERVMGL